MRLWLRKWWPLLKILLTVLILAAVGRRFVLDLWRLDEETRRQGRPGLGSLLQSLHPGWLVLSGALYLGALGVYNVYWCRLLAHLGYHPPVLVAIRAYYLGLLGKYLPGKAWALILRATLTRGGGVPMGVATLTAFYEVLTTMAAGALLSAVLFAVLLPAPDTHFDLAAFWHGLLRLNVPAQAVLHRNFLVLLSLGLLAGIGIPILPGVFNRIVHRLSLPFRESGTPPRIPARALLEGLVISSCGWCFMGTSLTALLRSFPDLPLPGGPGQWFFEVATMALAYVAGFVIIIVPSALGVREFFLTLLLVPMLESDLGYPAERARGVAVLAALLLRVVWTLAEVVITAVVSRFPAGTLDTQAPAEA